MFGQPTIGLWQRIKFFFRNRRLKENLHVMKEDVKCAYSLAQATKQMCHIAEDEREAMNKIIARLCDVVHIDPDGMDTHKQ